MKRKIGMVILINLLMLAFIFLPNFFETNSEKLITKVSIGILLFTVLILAIYSQFSSKK